LDRCGFSNYRDRLIFLGDAIDRGKESFEVVEKLLSIRNLIALRGNHDEWFTTFLRQNKHPMNWLQGGEETLWSYSRHCPRPITITPGSTSITTDLRASDIPAAHAAFFENQRLYFIDEQKRIFVHACWNMLDSIAETEANTPREFYWNRSLWQRALAFPADSLTRLRMADPYSLIFIGHTPTIFTTQGKEGKPLYRAGVWNLDTGAGYANGKVTVMDVESLQFWQSDLTSSLYPD
jgi:serine/threonine protein phosphatase 1